MDAKAFHTSFLSFILSWKHTFTPSSAKGPHVCGLRRSFWRGGSSDSDSLATSRGILHKVDRV